MLLTNHETIFAERWMAVRENIFAVPMQRLFYVYNIVIPINLLDKIAKNRAKLRKDNIQHLSSIIDRSNIYLSSIKENVSDKCYSILDVVYYCL